ncbi:MAG: T9SS type A sorting domain-containing protein, partial [Chitinophagales bacterium]|nr:T9SS type A sorting domain-containing protein [Chitinophagales bacterium]
ISIYNLQGQIVQTQQVNYGTSSIQINRNQLPAGTYMVSLTTDNGNKISKKLLIY